MARAKADSGKPHCAGDLIRPRVEPSPTRRLPAALLNCCFVSAPQSLDCNNVELCLDAVVCIMEFLHLDTASICAAACVSRTWRDAASTSAIWRMISVGAATSAVAGRMNGRTLAHLVRTAGAALVELQLSGTRMSDEDIGCLLLPSCPNLKKLLLRPAPDVDSNVTGVGVLECLRGRTANLSELKIKGLFANNDDPQGGIELVAGLRALMAPGCQPDVATICGCCSRLVALKTLRECEACGEVWCRFCDVENAPGHGA